MSDGALLEVSGVGKRFGGFIALADIALSVQPGERVGLVGPNGSGKSTLVNCICGTLRNETGSVRFAGRKLEGMSAHERTRLGLARSFQLPRPFTTMSLAENLRVPILYAVNVRNNHAMVDVDGRCDDLLRMVGLAEKAHRLPRDLTQIEMRKLELARAMASEPRLLISDEAMAGLSHGEVDDILALLLHLNEQGVHRHHDRAHHARGAGVLAAADRAGGRPQDRRRRSAGGGAPSRTWSRPTWQLASPSPAWRPGMGRCACCTTCR